MSYYIGRFYVGKRDIFLLLAVLLLGFVIYLDYSIPYFKPRELLVLSFLLLFTKSILLPTRDNIVFLTFFTAVALTLFIPFLQVLIFLFLSFFLLHLVRVL